MSVAIGPATVSTEAGNAGIASGDHSGARRVVEAFKVAEIFSHCW